MEDLLKRLELVEKYCSEEYNDLYYKLSNCRDKAIKMSYAEYMSGEKEHDYSNLYNSIDYENLKFYLKRDNMFTRELEDWLENYMRYYNKKEKINVWEE